MFKLTNPDQSLRRFYSRFTKTIVSVLAINAVGINAADYPSVNLDIKRDAQDKTLKRLVGEVVLITGDASNAKMGAILRGDNGIVFIKQLDRWSPKLYGNNLTVKGVLGVKVYKAQKAGEPRLPIPQGFLFFLDKYETLTIENEATNRK